MLTFGSLFAGIGGFDLGFERAGMACRWQVEIDPYCRRVLAKHWPDVRRHDDVRTFPPPDTDPRLWQVDVICGGFPCQDISTAGKGAGIDGARSGLWSEFSRIVRVVRPRFVVVENVPALLGRGLCRVLGDLAACGYDAEWDCIPACAVGADHRRDRVFIVAYPRRLDGHRRAGILSGHGIPNREGFADGAEAECPLECCGEDVAHPHIFGRRGQDGFPAVTGGHQPEDGLPQRDGYWRTEPAVGRVAYGIPGRVDRLKGLGNAVVPQVAEWIGRRIAAITADAASEQ